MKYITGTIRFDSKDQRKELKAAAKKLGIPFNRFMLIACQAAAEFANQGYKIQTIHKLIKSDRDHQSPGE